MIKGVHAMFYSDQADAMRAYIRDKLRLPYTDVGEGWLIFDLPEGDVGVHPTEGGHGDSGTHNVSFYCDDIEKTRKELEARGVVFDMAVEDHGYGLVTRFTMPGNVVVQLYQPRYVKKKPAAAKPKAKPAKKAAAKAKPAKKAKTPAKKAAAKPKKRTAAKKAPAKTKKRGR